jgi:hypothetical protein
VRAITAVILVQFVHFRGRGKVPLFQTPRYDTGRRTVSNNLQSLHILYTQTDTPTQLKQLVVGTGLCGVAPGALLLPVLCLAGNLEEQTGALALLDRVAEVAAVRGVAVVLNVLSARGVGQPEAVLLRDVLHDVANGLLGLGGRGGQGGQDRGGDEGRVGLRGEGDELGRRLQRDGGVRVAAQDTLNRRRRVEARRDAAAEGFDAGDGLGRGARDDYVDGCLELLWVLRAMLAGLHTSRGDTKRQDIRERAA